MTKERAEEIYQQYLRVFEEKRTIPGEMVDGFFQVYNTEINPGQFVSTPCTCSSQTWIEMVSVTVEKVREVLNG